MKLENLNFGRPLSREELKKVKGGTPQCLMGTSARCRCNDGTIMCVPARCTDVGCAASGVLCSYDPLGNPINVCYNHGGLAAPMDCSTNCPGNVQP
jgi:hypothetical protein